MKAMNAAPAGVAVQVVVVAAVRLVHDDDDVAAIGEERMLLPFGALHVGEVELLQRGEVDPPGEAARELVAQLLARGHVDGLSRQERRAVEGGEQLII